MQAYTGNHADAIQSVIDASPVASAIRELMQDRVEWTGTAAELLAELELKAGDSVTKGKEWPANGQALSRRLNRVKSAVRPAGIEIERTKLGGGQRQILISAWPESTREIAPIAPNSLKNRGDDGRNRAELGRNRKPLTLQRAQRAQWAQFRARSRGTGRKVPPIRPRCRPNRPAR